jgi:hypothetical protein
MLAYCRKNKRNVSSVVVADISRLARNVVDQGTTIAELKKLGIQLVSIDEPIIDDTAPGRLAANLLASFNQFFSDSLSQKTKFRMQAGVKQGRWLWVAPIGYKNESKTIALDNERAPLVRKSFELLNDGLPIGDVIRQVTALGLTTRKGRAIPKQTFSRMVRNPFYAGLIEQNGNVRSPLLHVARSAWPRKRDGLSRRPGLAAQFPLLDVGESRQRNAHAGRRPRGSRPKLYPHGNLRKTGRAYHPTSKCRGGTWSIHISLLLIEILSLATTG